MREQVELLEHHADLRPHRGHVAVGMGVEHTAFLLAIGGLAVDANAALLSYFQVIQAAQQR
jgi:hypothetical protein